MKIQGTITMCQFQKGKKEATGEEWMKAKYCIVYDGHYANGTACKRSLVFDVFGENRLRSLAMHKDDAGTLEFETFTRNQVSKAGNAYITNEIDILSWTPAGKEAPATVTAQPKEGSIPAPAPAPATEESNDLPF